ncbi:MAG: RdgB/HAM1 family non-canonical purine NTP pyrophosphatase [Bacteroidales bacterium]|nr:RdgB/HAM1 family non-canonical purine NTP pyrophosphatase [Bacteroidales bacterium]
MKEFVFASHNHHKVNEIRQIAGQGITILSLKDIGFTDPIPESMPTLEGNALQKARTVFHTAKKACFADDTGLEIEALNGMPGVKSARYAGEDQDFIRNMRKVLSEMNGIANRRARFRTVIALIINDSEYLFEGMIEGTIMEAPRGLMGFGYDPIFQPSGYRISFAEMDAPVKNRISHRGIAFRKLMDHLNSL